MIVLDLAFGQPCRRPGSNIHTRKGESKEEKRGKRRKQRGKRWINGDQANEYQHQIGGQMNITHKGRRDEGLIRLFFISTPPSPTQRQRQQLLHTQRYIPLRPGAALPEGCCSYCHSDAVLIITRGKTLHGTPRPTHSFVSSSPTREHDQPLSSTHRLKIQRWSFFSGHELRDNFKPRFAFHQ